MIRLAIAGTGMAGAYLYRRLKNEGRSADLFDPQHRSACGLTPCAWGTSRGFDALVARAGLDPEAYVLRRLSHVVMDGVELPGELLTFDKPRLIRDLLGGASIRPGPVPVAEYERVIDATGVERALLPPLANDAVMTCRQYLVESEEPQENRIQLGGIGYAWRFPLASGLCHTGCGSFLADPQRILEGLGWVDGHGPSPAHRVRCGCVGRIRLTGPHRSLPFVGNGCAEGVWGVGEAIGCVAPLAGDGVVPAMRSVELLLAHWERPEAYAQAVLAEFAWMQPEREIVDRLRASGRFGLRDASVLRTNAKRMGLRVGVRQALTLLRHLR